MAVHSERGMAAVETVIALTFIIILITGGLGIMYFSFARVWLHRTGYEALVCLATAAPEEKCRSRARAAIGDVLRIGQLKRLHLIRFPSEARLDFHFRISEHVDIHHRDSVRLPLTAESGR